MRLSTFRNTPTLSGNPPVWSLIARPAGLRLPPDRSAISTAQVDDLGLEVGEGARIVARFAREVDGESREFALPGEVRNLAAAGGSDDPGWDHGIELEPVPATDAARPTAYLESRRLDS